MNYHSRQVPDLLRPPKLINHNPCITHSLSLKSGGASRVSFNITNYICLDLQYPDRSLPSLFDTFQVSVSLAN